MTIRIEQPAGITAVQDLGRWGWQRYGVSVGGAADRRSLHIANWLVGNAKDAAAIEIALVGPTLTFESPTLIAVYGGMLEAASEADTIPFGRPVFVPAGTTIRYGPLRAGRFAYLAVAGGIDVPKILGSRSTHLLAGFGGHEGRTLQAGDRLAAAPPSQTQGHTLERMAMRVKEGHVASTRWFVPSAALSATATVELRVLRGVEFDWLSERGQAALFEREWRVSPQSDRMGYRLTGKPLEMCRTEQLLSEPVCPGTIQLPPDGLPIVLMADSATTGGYPKVAHVIDVDLPTLAQLRPENRVRFREVSLTDAHALLRVQAHELQSLQTSIHLHTLEV